MITGAQPKILLNMDENGNLQMDSEMGKLLFGGNTPKWKLVRERDGLTKVSEKIMWIEFDEVGRFRDKWDNIGVDNVINKIMEINPNYTISFVDSINGQNDILVAKII